MLEKTKFIETSISDEEYLSVYDQQHFRRFKEKVLKDTLLNSFKDDIKISEEYINESKRTILRAEVIFLNKGDVLTIIRLIRALYNEYDLKEPELKLLNEVLNIELKNKQ